MLDTLYNELPSWKIKKKKSIHWNPLLRIQILDKILIQQSYFLDQNIN